MSRLKQLGKDSVIYGLGGIFAKGISFFLLPIYTRIFTPAEYGVIEMLLVIANFVAAILTMGMDSAQSFYFSESKSRGLEAQVQVVSDILGWRITWGVFVVLVAATLSPLLNSLIFGDQLSYFHFICSFLGALFSQSLTQATDLFRLLFRPFHYIGATIAQSVCSAILVLSFVLIFDQGILGFILGSMMGSAFAATVGWYLLRDYVSFSSFSAKRWRRLIKFGAPLLPAGLAFYGMSMADRWFVQHYHGESALGVYAVGAKLSMLMVLAVDTFRNAWWPIAMDALHADDGHQTFRIVARLYVCFGVVAIVVLTFASPALVAWFSGPDFREAWPLVGVLAWPALFHGLFLVVSIGIWKSEKTGITLLLMSGAAILNLILNYVLVPAFGGLGAALATTIAYGAWVSAC